MRIRGKAIWARYCLTVIGLIGASAWNTANPVDSPHDEPGMVCNLCHTPHDSRGGSDLGDVGLQEHLLTENGNDLCLSCHDQNRAQAPWDTDETPKVKNAGTDLAAGDFANTDSEHGSNTGRGHNLGPGLTPAGGAGSMTLSCLSCHVSHRNGNYRLLLGTVNGVSGISVKGVGDPDWERTNSPTDHNVYQTGMTSFCGACHTAFHGGVNTGSSSPYEKHPQDMTGIEPESPLIGTYDPATPVEDPQAANASSYTVGPANSEVFCLSCHRAHASPHNDSGRWDFGAPNGSGKNCNACHGN